MIKKCLPLVVITVILALLIVWERVQTTKYGYDVAKLQNKIAELQERNRGLECDVSALRKPQRIVQSVESLRLDLAQPLENIDRLAQAKQQRGQRGKSNKITVLASARAKPGYRKVNNSRKKVRTKGNRR